MQQALFAIILTLAAIFSLNAHAQLSDQKVAGLVGLAIENIERAICADGTPCAPATLEEKLNPPVSVDEARIVIGRATLTALAEYCELEGNGRNFLPMMRYWQDTMNKDGRTLALIGLVHGIAAQQIGQALEAGPPCSDEMRAQTEARLTFTPPL